MTGKSKARKSERDLVVEPEFLDDLRYWVEHDRKIALKAFELIEATLREPFAGIGKPEQLRYGLQGSWSRRLTQEHRIVYVVEGSRVRFVSARYHYR